MNNRISLNSIFKIVNILFLIVLENFLFDCGMGFLGISLLFFAALYNVFFGGLQTGISKMVSMRNSKGLNSNAQIILKPALIYVGIVGILLCLISLVTAPAFCLKLTGTTFMAPILQVLSFVFLVNGITDAVCGYQNGNTNAVILHIATLLKTVLPILLIFVFFSPFKEYGNKVATLLKIDYVTNAYMALAVVCVYFFTSLIVLIAVLVLSVRLRLPKREGRNLRSMDTKKMTHGAVFTTAFKISLHQWFPVVSIFAAGLLYLYMAGKTEITAQRAFVNCGILFSRVFLPAAFILAIFSEYITREKYRLHNDYRKQDPKTAMIRTQYIIKNSFFMLLPPSVILTFLADPLVKVFYTGQYSYAAKVLQAAGFLVLCAGIAQALNAVMKAAGMDPEAFGTQILSFVVQLIFLGITLKSTNASFLYVVYSFYLFFGIQILFGFVLVYKKIRPDIMDILYKIGKYGAAAIVMMVLFIILDRFVMMNVLLMILSVILGYLLYYLTLIALRAISKKDEMALKRTLNYYPVAFLRSRLRL